MLVAFGLAESVIGKIKTAWVSVITTLGGVALGMGLCSLSDGRSPNGMRSRMVAPSLVR